MDQAQTTRPKGQLHKQNGQAQKPKCYKPKHKPGPRSKPSNAYDVGWITRQRSWRLNTCKHLPPQNNTHRYRLETVAGPAPPQLCFIGAQNRRASGETISDLPTLSFRRRASSLLEISSDKTTALTLERQRRTT
ncbi:hypothetical protein Rs2_35769 [Raphanus sativus]|nr:hypothetical protein Rs2_35769 [Raphanus sativus]